MEMIIVPKPPFSQSKSQSKIFLSVLPDQIQCGEVAVTWVVSQMCLLMLSGSSGWKLKKTWCGLQVYDFTTMLLSCIYLYQGQAGRSPYRFIAVCDVRLLHHFFDIKKDGATDYQLNVTNVVFPGIARYHLACVILCLLGWHLFAFPMSCVQYCLIG